MGSEITKRETLEATQNLLASMAGSHDLDWVVALVHPGLVQQLWALSTAPSGGATPSHSRMIL